MSQKEQVEPKTTKLLENGSEDIKHQLVNWLEKKGLVINSSITHWILQMPSEYGQGINQTFHNDGKNARQRRREKRTLARERVTTTVTAPKITSDSNSDDLSVNEKRETAIQRKVFKRSLGNTNSTQKTKVPKFVIRKRKITKKPSEFCRFRYLADFDGFP